MKALCFHAYKTILRQILIAHRKAMLVPLVQHKEFDIKMVIFAFDTEQNPENAGNFVFCR